LSRVQRFHFRPVPTEVVAEHLRQISDKEHITIDNEALLLITERGDGSFRDSISLLDQLSRSDVAVTRSVVEQMLGLASETTIAALIDSLHAHDVTTIITTLTALFADGISPSLIVSQLTHELSQLAPNQPKLYILIEKLLEVAKSTIPSVKLMAILAQAATENTPSRTVAAIVTPPKVIQAEEKLATIIEQDIVKESAPAPIDVTNAPTDIVWEDILSAVKDLDQPGVSAALKFADFTYNDGTLTLYFAKLFHRNRAEKPNFRDTLHEALKNLYETAPHIVIAKSAVPEDSAAAQVLDIMGGGEVVKSGEA
jgi:DNA polymerase-3 subunit gamma/tau